MDAHEAFDALPTALDISAFFTGNRDYANLPRKFKISVTGCLEDCAQSEINDIGLGPARADDGTLGFNVLAGGGLSDGERMASDIDVFIEPGQAVELTRAIAQLFGELGNRENRGLARMRYLVQELGAEGFRAELEARTRFPLWSPPGRASPGATVATTSGVHPQRQEGLVYVGCSVPVGRMSGIELVEIARLATTYGDGTVRLGSDQNFILSGVAEGDVDRLLDEELLQKYSPFPGPFERGVVACTGERVLPFRRGRDQGAGRDLGPVARRPTGGTDRPDGRGPAPTAGATDDAGVIRMHFSGCPASCAQPQIADMGFRGDTAHVGDHLVEAVDIGLGWFSRVRTPPSSTGSRTPVPSTRCPRPCCGS